MADSISGQYTTETGIATESELVDSMAPRIRFYGLRHLRDANDAEDLVQEVLIVMLEAIRCGRIRDTKKIASFVLGTCRLTVLNMKRNRANKERLNERLAKTETIETPPPTETCNVDDLVNCLQKLRERERSVVTLSFFDDKTSSDVASFLGVSESNVRVIRHRAISQLRKCMGVPA